MKLDRLLAITMLLLNRKRVGAKELADRFEVSLRTIYRDLDTINQAGIPIVSYAGADGGYELMDKYRLDRQMLSLDELQSIIIALKGVQATMDDREISTLLDKVGALVTRSEQVATESLHRELLIDINPWHGGEEEKEKLAVLRQAIRESRLVNFTYTSGFGDDSQRDCEPMAVVIKGYLWYLYGYCRLREDYRVFRISRIGDLVKLQEPFHRREGEITQLGYQMDSGAASNWRDKEVTRLVLRFEPSAKARVYDYFDRAAIETEAEGTLLVTTGQPEEPWLYSMLLGYGEQVTVIEPQRVALELVRQAENIIKRYR